MKKCSMCKIEKSESEFHKNKTKADGLQHRCKICKKKTDRLDYVNNNRRAEVGARNLARKLALRKIVLEYLNTHPCVDCGNSDVRVLEFDHMRDKCYNVSQIVQNGLSEIKLLSEIAKCEVRCCNCHRIKTRETLWNVGELVDPLGSDPRHTVGSKPTVPAK